MRKSAPTKLETKQLPNFNYLGLERIIVPVTADDFAAAVLHLTSARIVGFDTESLPTFEKGQVSDGPHVVQFASESHAYIFQLSNPESHNPLLYLLATEDVKKIGFDLGSDRKLLLKKFGVLPRGLIDLRPVFKKQGYRNTVGIRAAVAIVFNEQFNKSKSVTMSNWRKAKLSDSQLLYAANDAYAALIVYLKLLDNTKAIEYHKMNIELHCGYSTDRWHTDYDGHTLFAGAIGKATADAENKVREIAIKQCRDAWLYAEQGVLQNEENLNRNCGFTGAIWHSDKSSHFSWAMHKTPYNIAIHDQKRRALLNLCES